MNYSPVMPVNNEEWRPYRLGYSVSSHGRVRNDQSGYILKPFPTGFGNAYLGVDLSGGKRSVRLRRKVH